MITTSGEYRARIRPLVHDWTNNAPAYADHVALLAMTQRHLTELEKEWAVPGAAYALHRSLLRELRELKRVLTAPRHNSAAIGTQWGRVAAAYCDFH